MHIVCYGIEKWEFFYLQRKCPKHTFTYVKKDLSFKNIVKDADAIVIFVYSSVTEDILANMPTLKLIVTLSTGYDHIDLTACENRSIVVCNVPHYGDTTVSEHAFALLLNISRRIHESIEYTKNGSFTQLEGFDLCGKTLGIIGLGNIGKRVAIMGKAFGMNIIGYDINKDKKSAKKIGYSYVALSTLFKKADVISLHCVLTEKTRHIIDKNALLKMKKGIVIINAARGELIDTTALLSMLKKKHVRAVGLDVSEEERCIRDEKLFDKYYHETCDVQTMLENHILMERDDVFITPHNGFHSREALHRILDGTVDNIKSKKNRI